MLLAIRLAEKTEKLSRVQVKGIETRKTIEQSQHSQKDPPKQLVVFKAILIVLGESLGWQCFNSKCTVERAAELVQARQPQFLASLQTPITPHGRGTRSRPREWLYVKCKIHTVTSTLQ